MEPPRSVWHASPGSQLPGKRTSSATGSCQLPRPKTPDALPDQCLLVRPDLPLRRCRMASLGSCLVGGFINHLRHFRQALKTDQRETRSKDYGKRDPQVRSTLGVKSREWSSGEEHSWIGELSRLRAGKQRSAAVSNQGMEPHRSVWHASPGSQLPGKRTTQKMPNGVLGELPSRWISLITYDISGQALKTDQRETRSKDYGKRDPQVRSTLGVQRREWSSGEGHSRIGELSRLRVGRQSRDNRVKLLEQQQIATTAALATTARILANSIIYIGMEPPRSVWHVSPGSQLPRWQTSSATGSCQLPRPKTPDALLDQCLLVCPDLQIRRFRMASLGGCLIGGFIDHLRHFRQALKTYQRETRSKDYGKRDPQVRSTLGVHSREWSSGEEHSWIGELSRLRAGRQSRQTKQGKPGSHFNARAFLTQLTSSGGETITRETKVSFGRGQHTTEGVIDYVHADPWGSSRVESMSGCQYLLSIVDDYSRMSGLPDSFWAEAMATASYLINRSLSTALEKKTPIDLWSRHPMNYEMLRIFGCVAYSHMNQGKLKPRAIKCIFLGYPDGVKGYKLWRLDDIKPKIIISRDVVFNKSLMYNDTLKGAGAADSGKEVEFEVELQGSRVEPTVDPHTG
ncbi:retrovirus-related pol polyprotein from transposon TNT 1-94 [Tanacetum coccineum]